MSSEPQVSVVVPAYNHATYIERCLESVGTQAVDGLELVIVDDASTDDTATKIQGWLSSPAARRLFGTQFLQNDRNMGAHAALQRGIEASSARRIFLINSDDTFAPGRIEALASQLKDQVSVTFSRCRFVGDTDEPVWSAQAARHEMTVNWICDNLPTVGWGLMHEQWALSTGNLAFTRDLYEKLGGFVDLRYCHDWDFLLRSTLYCEPIFVDASLYNYRVHGTNSFSGLGHVADRESAAVIANFFLEALGPVANLQAPTPNNWPGAFEVLRSVVATAEHIDRAIGNLPRYVKRRLPSEGSASAAAGYLHMRGFSPQRQADSRAYLELRGPQ
jgi:glycosyltransferase involved in cell wall biosynthesis